MEKVENQASTQPSVQSEIKLEKMSIAELIGRLPVDISRGLESSEAGRRIEQYGYNELTEKRQNPWLKLVSYFWGPIPWMIEAAALLSAFVRNWVDFTIITILLLINVLVGFWEEYQADNVIEALKKKLALKARVVREGQWKTVEARQLVPGDIIRLRLGDIIPADSKLLLDDEIQVDESALTGESFPVSRHKEDSVYSGSIVNRGETNAMVYATGSKTYFGKTTAMVESVSTTSHFQKAVLKIGDYLIVIAVILVVLIITVGLFRHEKIPTLLRFALVLTVAAIPVAMPTVLSVTMAVGAKLLAAKEAIVRKLAAIEELAGVDVLCLDKTGTLTQNRLKLENPIPIAQVDAQEIIFTAAMASRAEDQDPIDIAVLDGVKDKSRMQSFVCLKFTPFDPVAKRTEAEIQSGRERFKVSKGSPQVILNMAANKEQIRDKVEQEVAQLAKRGFRSLGVAKTDAFGQWHYMGILPLYDPPREDTKSTIEAARAMGIQTKMVTGDQIAIGKEIARQAGMGTNLLDAQLLQDSKHYMSGQLAQKIEAADGFAQVFPEHKFYIVEALQQRGHIVGMTGDGVNDAPALKKADAGIAVSGSTDAARGAAAIVLLSSGISVIIDAIKESRRIFARMNHYVVYRIAETIRVLLFMTLSILVFNFYPVTAVMIVLLALLNDSAILSIAYDRAEVSSVPVKWNMIRVLGMATALGITGVAASFGLFFIAEHQFHLNRDMIQTLMYLKLSVAGHFMIFATRTRGPFWSDRPSNILLFAVIGTQIIATIIAMFGIYMTPLGWQWSLAVWGYALIWFLIADQVKLCTQRIFDHNQPGLLTKKRANQPGH